MEPQEVTKKAKKIEALLRQAAEISVELMEGAEGEGLQLGVYADAAVMLTLSTRAAETAARVADAQLDIVTGVA